VNQPEEIKGVFQSFIGTRRYFSIRNLKLKDHDDLEAMEMALLKNYLLNMKNKVVDYYVKF